MKRKPVQISMNFADGCLYTTVIADDGTMWCDWNDGKNWRQLADLPQPDEAIVHGVNCKKELHEGDGYLHDAKDDTMYNVDGLDYCGRCHR